MILLFIGYYVANVKFALQFDKQKRQKLFEFNII